MEQIRKALEKFVQAYEYKNCVHTTLLAEAYEDAKAALAEPTRTCDTETCIVNRPKNGWVVW